MRFSFLGFLCLFFISGTLSAQIENGTDLSSTDTGFAARYIIHDEHWILAPHHYEGGLK